MKNLLIVALLTFAWAPLCYAEEMEIEVPNGWTATESGIVKGGSELSVGPVLDLGELSSADYLTKLAKQPFEELELTSVGETQDGDIVVQVVREVLKDGNAAKSILFICKGGRNRHRLLELFTSDVFAVISGGKAAIGFCSQP